MFIIPLYKNIIYFLMQLLVSFVGSFSGLSKNNMSLLPSVDDEFTIFVIWDCYICLSVRHLSQNNTVRGSVKNNYLITF